MFCECSITGPPSESGRNFEVVNVTDKQDYFLNMTWESSPDPVKHYAVEYNGFNLTTSSTAISIPVNCSSAVNIYITAIGPCGKPSPRVQVISVNTSICESSSAMVTRASEQLNHIFVYYYIHVCHSLCVFMHKLQYGLHNIISVSAFSVATVTVYISTSTPSI